MVHLPIAASLLFSFLISILLKLRDEGRIGKQKKHNGRKISYTTSFHKNNKSIFSRTGVGNIRYTQSGGLQACRLNLSSLLAICGLSYIAAIITLYICYKNVTPNGVVELYGKLHVYFNNFFP